MKDAMNMLHTTIATVAMMVATQSAWAEVYKVVDENGNVTYTDQAPDSSAKPMELRGLSVISPQKPPAPVASEQPAAEASADGEEVVTSIRELRRGYRDFRIVAPKNDEQIRGTGNQTMIAWDTSYRLQPGMTVTFVLDGNAQEPTTAQSMTTGRLDRGEHKVYAELVDDRNRRIATTETVTFYIRQWSVNFGTQQQQQASGGG